MKGKKNHKQQKRQPRPQVVGAVPANNRTDTPSKPAPTYADIIGQPAPDVKNFVVQSDLYQEITPRAFKTSGEGRYFAYGSDFHEDWSIFFGANKKMPLLRRVQQMIEYSPTNSAILQTKLRYAFGGRMLFNENSPNAKRNEQALNALKIHKLIKSVGFDYIAYGTAFAEVKLEGKTFGANHIKIDYARIRGENGRYLPTTIGFSYAWYEGGHSGEDIVDIPIFDESEKLPAAYHRAFVVKTESVGRLYWGIASYVLPALASSETDYHAPRYNANYFKNGCKNGTLVGIVTGDAEVESKINAVKKDMSDPENAHKPIVVAFRQMGENPNDKITVNDLHSFTEGAFLGLKESSVDDLARAHRCPPALANIAVSGKLGNIQQLQSEHEIFVNTVIAPIQEEVRESFIAPLFKLIDNTFGTTLAEDFVGFEIPPPTSLRPSIVPNEVLTVDEQRALLGYSPLTDEQLVKGMLSNSAVQGKQGVQPQPATEPTNTSVLGRIYNKFLNSLDSIRLKIFG